MSPAAFQPRDRGSNPRTGTSSSFLLQDAVIATYEQSIRTLSKSAAHIRFVQTVARSHESRVRITVGLGCSQCGAIGDLSLSAASFRTCAPVTCSLWTIRVHKDARARRFMEQFGATLAFLPPYSYDFDPIVGMGLDREAHSLDWPTHRSLRSTAHRAWRAIRPNTVRSGTPMLATANTSTDLWGELETTTRLHRSNDLVYGRNCRYRPDLTEWAYPVSTRPLPTPCPCSDRSRPRR
jgi:hypothetical protein